MAEREVGLLDLARLEGGLEGRQRRLGLRDDEAAGGLLVEAVHEADPLAEGGGRAEPVQERVHDRRVRRAARRVDHHARGLVEHHEVAVLEQDRERQVLRDEARRLRVRDRQLHALTAVQPRRGLGGAAVEEDEAGVEEALGAGAGEVGGEPRQGHVEAEPRQVRRGDERAGLRHA